MPEGTLLNVNVPAGKPRGAGGDEARQAPLRRRAEAGRGGREGPPPLPDLRLRALVRGRAGHRPGRARARQGRADADPLRPHPPRRPRRARRVGPGRPPRAPRRRRSRPHEHRSSRARRRAQAPSRVPQRALLRQGRPRDRGRRVRRSDQRASRARGGAPGAADARVADAARRRQAALALRGGRAPRADALARERALRGGHARVGEADREPAQALRHHGCRDLVRHRAEDRRARHLADLRERQVHPRGDARRRPRRRGRHPQPEDDQRHSEGDLRRARDDRGARRDLLPALRLHQA